jgi:hypothetical protein
MDLSRGLGDVYKRQLDISFLLLRLVGVNLWQLIHN